MLSPSQTRSRLAAMIGSIEAPPVPMYDILSLASRLEASPPIRGAGLIPRVSIAAAIAIGAICAAVPIVAPGVVQTLQARIAQLMQWTPPPPAPKSVRAAMVSRVVTLKTAQTLVDFRIVPPAGLPRDVVAAKIVATPTAVYSKVTRRWSVGPPSLDFSYRRAHGREFELLADAYDPREGMPPKYILNADERGPDGLPKRHQNFAWRNGDQTMGIVEDENISAAEIETIRVAMHGIALPLATTRAELNAGSIVKMYAVP